jgi:hypothetical protein
VHRQHLEIIEVFYSPTDAQVSCLKNNIKIYIKTAPTCFGAVTPSSGSVLFMLAKVTVVKIANYGTLVCGGVAAYISGSVMNNSVSRTLIIDFLKQTGSYQNWLDLPL